MKSKYKKIIELRRLVRKVRGKYCGKAGCLRCDWEGELSFDYGKFRDMIHIVRYMNYPCSWIPERHQKEIVMRKRELTGNKGKHYDKLEAELTFD